MAAAKLKDPPAPSQCVEGDVVISLILQTVTPVRLSPRRTDATLPASIQGRQNGVVDETTLVHVQETSLGMPCLPFKSPLAPLSQRGE